MINHKVVVSTPGKIILLGEHAVVYGEPAISMAINKRTKVSLEKISNGVEIISDKYGKRKFSLWGIEEYGRKIDKILEKGEYNKVKPIDPFQPIEYELYNIFNYYEYDDVKIKIESNVGKNLGSSSSVAVGIAAALERYFSSSNKFSIDKVIRFANSLDTISHGGTPSGVDATTVAVGGTIYFVENYYERIDTDIKKFIVVDSGEEAKTYKTVSRVRKLAENKDYRIKIKRLGEIVEEVRNGNVKLSDAMIEYYKVLCEFGISTKRLDEIVSIFLENGGVAKPTGGWRGGNCIGIGNEEIKKKLKLKGYNFFEVRIDEGIKFLE